MRTLGGGNPWASHKREVGGQRPGAVGDALDVALRVEVEVHPVHLEPHPGVVLDAGAACGPNPAGSYRNDPARLT